MSAPAEDKKVIDDVYKEDAADDIELDDAETSPEQLEHERQQQEAAAMTAGSEDSLRENEAHPHEDEAHPHEDEAQPHGGNDEAPRDPTIPCAHCGQPMGNGRGPTTKDGPIHVSCVLEYKYLHQPRCHYCGIRFLDSEASRFVKDEATGRLYHPECRQQELKGVPYVRPSKEGEVRKYAIARSKLSRHNWKTRYFILSPMYDGIRYFEHNPYDEGKKDGKKEDKKDGGSSDDSPSGDDNFDPDADPKLVEEHAKKAKGLVPLDRKRARLITHPAASLYKISSAEASMQNDIAIIFFDSADSNTEHRLLFQCKDKEQKQEWVRALEGYIHTVDDPRDYGAAKDAKDAKDTKGSKKK